MNKLKDTRILHMPIWLYLIFLVVTLVVATADSLPNSMIGALCLAIMLGFGLGFIGDRIPIWKDWLGGGMLFTCLAAGAINTFGLLPENVINSINNFNGTIGFLDLYIVILITGSILSIDRKMLVKSFGGYIPTILGSIAVSFIFCALASLILGKNPIDTIINIAMPIMGGGNGAGAIPMSQIYGEVTGLDSTSWYATAFATLSLGNLVAVLFGALLNRLGQKKPNLTGNGALMMGSENEKGNELTLKPELGDYAAGLALALFCYVACDFYDSKISLINNANFGFTIHKFAFIVILVAILNVSGLIPENIRAGAKGMQQFFTKYMSLPLMVTVGIGTNLADYAKVLSPVNMVIIIMVVVGAVLGAALVGRLFKFYPIEAAITAGLCMANGGGSGDVQVLGAANRMEMMSYAQISSRIGGAIMLVIASFVFGHFL